MSNTGISSCEHSLRILSSSARFNTREFADVNLHSARNLPRFRTSPLAQGRLPEPFCTRLSVAFASSSSCLRERLRVALFEGVRMA